MNLNIPYFTRIKEMDRVGVEPTTSAMPATFYLRAVREIENCIVQIPPAPLWTLHNLIPSSKFEKASQSSKTDYVTYVVLQF